MSAAESPGARALSGDSGALRALAGTWAAAGERLRAGEPARRAQLAFDAGGRGQVVRALGHGAAVLGGQSGRLGATLADAGNALRGYAEATEELRDTARSLERRRQLAASTAGSREPAEPFGTGAAVVGNPGTPGDDGAAARASRGLIVCDERREDLDRRVAARLRELSARLRRLSEAGPRSGGIRGADGTGDGAETAQALAALTALCRVERPGGRLRLRALPGQAVSAAVRSGGPGEGFGVLAVRLLEFGRALGRVASAAGGSVLPSAALTLQSAFLVAGRHASGVPGLPGRAVMFALVSGLGIRQGGPRVAVGAFALLELDIGRLAAAGRLPRTVQGLIIGGRLLGGFRDAELRVLPEGRGAGPGGAMRGDPAAEDRAREYR
ncbi:hypothetical protein, partial [Leucobacter sp. M11]|uniref:hypothetical protein n=1 Tax=Leucobacter sp. M11 TaxID=2993565 RepID=UPI002D80FE31